MTGRWATAVGAMATVAVLAGCSRAAPPPSEVDLGEPASGIADVTAHLDAARAAWDAAAIADYVVTYEMQCLCPIQTVTVVVRGGRVTDHHPADGREALTVPDLFARIAAALGERPDDVQATFDAATGVPIDFHVDPDANGVDEEWGFVIEFEPDGSLPSAPESVDAADLTEHWGCGHGFHASNVDQTVALHVIPTAVADPDRGPLPDAVVPSGAYTVEVNIGLDLFANWCDDVIEPEEPTPLVVEDWPAVGGQIGVVNQPSGGCTGQPVTIAITGLVVERPDGQTVEVGDVTITNDAWGCFAG